MFFVLVNEDLLYKCIRFFFVKLYTGDLVALVSHLVIGKGIKRPSYWVSLVSCTYSLGNFSMVSAIIMKKL